MKAVILDLPAQHYTAYHQAQSELEGLFLMLAPSCELIPAEKVRERLKKKHEQPESKLNGGTP